MTDELRKETERLCGMCRLPIRPNEPGVRHFGWFEAHSEHRCIDLLRAELDRLRQQLAEVEDERDRMEEVKNIYAGRFLAASDSLQKARQQLAEEEEQQYADLLDAVSRGLRLEIAALDQHARVAEWRPFDPTVDDIRTFHPNRYRVVAERGEPVADIPDYDAGMLNDWGGGNTDWWLDYLRAEIGRCNDYWRSCMEDLAPPAQSAVPEGWRKALHEAVGAIHFDDAADLLPALWSVVRELSPEVAALLEKDSSSAWHRSEAMLSAAPSAGEAQGDDAKHRVSTDRRDLFDNVRGALAEALQADSPESQAEAWHEATRLADEALKPLIGTTDEPAQGDGRETRRPMETAPTDGTKVQLELATMDGPIVTPGVWKDGHWHAAFWTGHEWTSARVDPPMGWYPAAIAAQRGGDGDA